MYEKFMSWKKAKEERERLWKEFDHAERKEESEAKDLISMVEKSDNKEAKVMHGHNLFLVKVIGEGARKELVVELIKYHRKPKE